MENTATSHAAQTCLILAIFFLLRPGEYLGMPSLTQFRFRDLLRFWIGPRALEHRTCDDFELQAATFVTMAFTRQKNGVRNETVGHGRSGHARLCPPVHAALASHPCYATPCTGGDRRHAYQRISCQSVGPLDTCPRVRSHRPYSGDAPPTALEGPRLRPSSRRVRSFDPGRRGECPSVRWRPR
jgi:hypothetical protein